MLGEFYGGHPVQVEQVQGDPRELFALRVTAQGVASLADLKERVGTEV